MPTAPFMCLDGEIVPYAEAKVHAFTAVVKYGCGVFEGIRAYWSEAQRELFVFRLPEHLERLRFGMKLMRFAEVYPCTYLADCVLRTLRALRDERFDVLHVHEPCVPGAPQTTLFYAPAPIVGTFHAAGTSAAHSHIPWPSCVV